jgi:hypothetical protein
MRESNQTLEQSERYEVIKRFLKFFTETKEMI